jgi:DNA-binding response OmpR family regulator
MQDSPAPELFTTRRIAIVEGDRQTAEMLHTFFGLMDLEPSLIDPGPGAVATLRRLRPHVLLLDLDLPDLRALDIAREVEGAIPIIYLCAHDKPKGFDDLLGIMEKVLEV